MDRMACVDLPAFPLQLLLRRHPEWNVHPAAVVDRDTAQGKVLWVNERGRGLRILPGMRYAAALSLSQDLRAAEVPPPEIEEAVTSMVERLRHFTPEVEGSREEPGVFWLNATGLERLHGSWSRWGNRVHAGLKGWGFFATVVVGFTRFGTYAVARARRGVLVFSSPEDERRAARRVPLERLALVPQARDTLARLGVMTVGAFLDLPPEGVEKRFGKEIHRLYRLASGELWSPLVPEAPRVLPRKRWCLEYPESEVERLMHLIERLLLLVLEILAKRGEALTEVRLRFTFDRMGHHSESLRPAAATLEVGQLAQLIRLRLEAIHLPDGVVEVELEGEGVEATQEQLQLFAQRPRRDLEAANRALARVRAELGDDAVAYASLREGHLPEAGFAWKSLAEVKAPQSPTPQPMRSQALKMKTAVRTLVRRIYAPAFALPARARQEPDGWMLRGLKRGPVVRLLGPYIVSGGWWRKRVHREYHFAETQKGDLLWIYYDRAQRRWFLQGRVE